jgi:hypothetical protein
MVQGKARLRLAHRPLRRDQCRAAGEIAGVEQPVERHLDEIRIGQEQVAVGEGQPAGLGHQVQGLRRTRRMAGQIEALQDAHDLQDRDAAGGGRRHAADPQVPIGRAERRAPLGAVAGQVRLAHLAGIVLDAAHGGDDGRGRLALIEALGPGLGDTPQADRIVGISQHLSDGMRRTFGIVEVGARGGELAQMLVPGEQPVQARRYFEALLGQADRRLEQAPPSQTAMLTVDQFQHGHQPRNPDRAASDHRLTELHRLAIGPQKEVGPRHNR